MTVVISLLVMLTALSHAQPYRGRRVTPVWPRQSPVEGCEHPHPFPCISLRGGLRLGLTKW